MKLLQCILTVLMLFISLTCSAEYVPDTSIWKEYYTSKKGTLYYAPSLINCVENGAYIWTLFAEKKTDIYYKYKYRLYFPDKLIESAYYTRVNAKTGRVLDEDFIEQWYQAGSVKSNPIHYSKYYSWWENIINEAYDKWLVFSGKNKEKPEESIRY